jgi:hypothetical protein
LKPHFIVDATDPLAAFIEDCNMAGTLLALEEPSPMTMEQFMKLGVRGGFAFDANVTTTTKKRAIKPRLRKSNKKRNVSPSTAGGDQIMSTLPPLGDGGFDIDPLHTLPQPLDDEYGTNATTDDLMDLLDVGFACV